LQFQKECITRDIKTVRKIYGEKKVPKKFSNTTTKLNANYHIGQT